MTTENELPSSLELLKNKATLLGIKFHPNIGEPKLLAKVKAHNAEPEAQVEATEEVVANPQTASEIAVEADKTTRLEAARNAVPPTVPYVREETPAAMAQRKRKEANKLVRIVATCMNPNKKAMTGEYFTVSNAVIGTIKKYVLFDSPDGWHVPVVIANHLKSRKCQIFVPSKTTTGKKIMKGKIINEFAIVELPSLSDDEMSALAARQAVSHAIDN